METIQVTTSRGTLFKRTFKNSTITSANTLLKGNNLVIQEGKVVSFTGTVNKTDNTEIGTFSYSNGENDPMMNPGMQPYKCEVSITNEADAVLQVEATKALLAGIGELTKEEIL